MDFLQKITELCNARGISLRQMERENGLGNGASSKWKDATPNSKVLLKLAQYFSVSTDYLLGIVDESTNYYIDPEAAALAEEMAKRPELKVLLSASRDISKEDLEFVNQLVQKMVRK